MALNPSVSWPAQTTAPTGAYPYGSAQNITVPGDNTGTPWVADLLDDIWGFLQQLLTASAKVVSGSADEVGASQYFESIQEASHKPGIIESVAWNAHPTTLDMRMLLLHGQGVLRTSYADLDTVCYVGDPDNPTADGFFHADDAAGAVRNVAGVYLILPDMRGLFLRGLDLTGLVDPDGASRIVGNEQLNSLQAHNHVVTDQAVPTYGFSSATGGAGAVDTVSSTPNKGLADTQASSVHCGNQITGFANILGVGNVTSETRPSNMAVDFAIWY